MALSDFIPISSTGEGDGTDPAGLSSPGKGGAPAASQTPADSNPRSYVFHVKMTGAWRPAADEEREADGDVHFVVRLYYSDDETNELNRRAMSGVDGHYDFPAPIKAGAFGFTLRHDTNPNSASTWPIAGGRVETSDYQTFVFRLDHPERPVHWMVLTYKPAGHNGHFTSVKHWDALYANENPAPLT